jgi:hypothetical protein
MKTTMKRMISLILVLACLCSMMIPEVFAAEYFDACSQSCSSIVEALNSVDASNYSSFSCRAKIAEANGIVSNAELYNGTAAENTAMLQLLKQNKLINPYATTDSEKVTIQSDKSKNTDTSEDTTSFTLPGSYEKAVTVTKNNAPLRTGPSEKESVAYRVPVGTVLEYSSTCRSSTGLFNFNQWYVIEYNGNTYYLFSGNAEIHSHSWAETLLYNDVTYQICNCGYVSVQNISQQKVGVMRSEVAAALAVAGGLSAADGPLPFGEMAGAVVLVAAMAVESSVTLSDTTYMDVVTDEAFSDYLKDNASQCSYYSFRRVIRVAGQLKYMDDYCLDAAQAYICARYLGIDVYTKSEDAALMMVATFFGSGICERDKDQTTYFYHYHLGTDRNIHTHVFFGTNDLGEEPI